MPPAPADRRSAGAVRDRLIARLGPVVAATGYDLEDVSVTSAGKRSLVRVIVDADGGVDLDAVADVSRAVSDSLDDASGGDAFTGPFVLEVSSPGVDRPLTEPRHWRRAVGRMVSVPAGGQTVTGRVTASGDEGVMLAIDGSTREIAFADLGAGKVQIEFQHRDRAGATDGPDDTDDTDEQGEA